jgi:hypothetical protein
VSPRHIVKERLAILDSGEEVEKLCRDFDVTDTQDIEGILSGRIGEAEW